MGLGITLAGMAAKGLAGAVFKGIFGKNNRLEDQEELMRKNQQKICSKKSKMITS
jgi:hypothetical protein